MLRRYSGEVQYHSCKCPGSLHHHHQSCRINTSWPSMREDFNYLHLPTQCQEMISNTIHIIHAKKKNHPMGCRKWIHIAEHPKAKRLTQKKNHPVKFIQYFFNISIFSKQLLFKYNEMMLCQNFTDSYTKMQRNWFEISKVIKSNKWNPISSLPLKFPSSER